jgi:hypothetical protein
LYQKIPDSLSLSLSLSLSGLRGGGFQGGGGYGKRWREREKPDWKHSTTSFLRATSHFKVAN